MSKREATIKMINALPEYKLDIVSAFVRFLLSETESDYEEDLRRSVQQADEGKLVYKTMDELKKMENKRKKSSGLPQNGKGD